VTRDKAFVRYCEMSDPKPVDVKTLIVILFTSVSTFSQMQLSLNGSNAQFHGEIEVLNRSAEELCQIASRWAARTYDNKGRYSKIENEIIRGEGSR